MGGVAWLGGVLCNSYFLSCMPWVLVWIEFSGVQVPVYVLNVVVGGGVDVMAMEFYWICLDLNVLLNLFSVVVWVGELCVVVGDEYVSMCKVSWV